MIFSEKIVEGVTKMSASPQKADNSQAYEDIDKLARAARHLAISIVLLIIVFLVFPFNLILKILSATYNVISAICTISQVLFYRGKTK